MSVPHPQHEEPALPFDELDQRLLMELRSDPRAPYAALGQRLGVTGMTVANRLHRLIDSGLIRLRELPNIEKCGLGTVILGLVKTDVPGLDGAQSSLAASPYVLSLHRVTGEFDLAFEAAFPSDVAMGRLVREVQAVPGVLRLVVHHRIERVRDDDGWTAVFHEDRRSEDSAYEVAPGTVIPRGRQHATAVAASWVDALAAANLERLRQLSADDIVFRIPAPHRSAGTFRGIREVERQAQRTRRAYNKIWYRLVSVNEGRPPFDVVIDALSPVEDHRGHVATRFSRMAFQVRDGRVTQVVNLGQMDLPDLADLDRDSRPSATSGA
jgi:Lrp/AsnC family leucine-responsive transcriptional regulator